MKELEAQFLDLLPTLLVVIFGLITIIPTIGEKIGWFSKKRKEQLEKEEEKRRETYEAVMDSKIKQFVNPLVDHFEQRDQEKMKILSNLEISSRDVLRQDLVKIYYKYLPYKKILDYDKEAFMKLYDDYKAQKGNGFIQNTVFKEISEWETVSTEEELKK